MRNGMIMICRRYMNVKDRHTKLTYPNVSAYYVRFKIPKNHILYMIFRHINRGTFSSFTCGPTMRILQSVVHYMNSVITLA